MANTYETMLVFSVANGDESVTALVEKFKAGSCELATLLCIAKGLDDVHVVTIAKEPARAVAAVVGEIIHFIPFWGGGEGLCGWVVVVVEVVAGAYKSVLTYFFTRTLLC